MKLLLGGDEAMMAGALRELGHFVLVADDVEQAVLAVERDGFDAIVVDRMLPGRGGVAAIRRLRERGATLPVLMLSALDRPDDRIGMLDAGADDVVVRPVTVAEVDARLRALMRGRRWSIPSADTIRAGDVVVSPSRHRAWRGGEALDLTRLEFRLLVELAREAGGFLTRASLVEQVWGHAVEPATNIVDAQIRCLRRKLTAAGGDDPIVTKRGVGYMLRG